MKCLSVCVCVRAKRLEGVYVCILSEEVCNSVWQWVIDSESQSQTLLRKHKVCMPGHIPDCLFIRLSELFVDHYDSPEQKDYDWIVGRHQHLFWNHASTISWFLQAVPNIDHTDPSFKTAQYMFLFFFYVCIKKIVQLHRFWLWNSQFSGVAQLPDDLKNRSLIEGQIKKCSGKITPAEYNTVNSVSIGNVI